MEYITNILNKGLTCLGSIIANMVWPALYVAGGYGQLWMYFILPTIVIEAIAFKLLVKTKWYEAILISILGNIVSAFAGTILMMYGMILYHFFADRVISYLTGEGGTFNDFNWAATFVLMCLGSVLLEVLTVKFALKYPIKKIFLPLLIGNALSYALTAILMANRIIKVTNY